MVVRALPLPPDPMALARAFEGRPGLAVLASRPVGAPRPSDARWSFVTCDPDAVSEDLVPPGCDGRERAAWNAEAVGPRWIGVIPYDALRSLERPGWTRGADARPPPLHARPSWRRYPAVLRIDHHTGAVCVEAESDEAADRLVRSLAPSRGAKSGFELRLVDPRETGAAHVARVRRALELIAAGDLYEVNLARRIEMTIQGDLLSLLTSLLEAAPTPWGFFQDLGGSVVCASSPELALAVHGDALRTCPVKGTRPRGRDAVADRCRARELEDDPKERAELIMAVDVHRNDLGVVAVAGSVHVNGEPRVLAGRTVWSRMAEVVARRSPGVSLEAVVRACLPSGSVTGAPKVRAMEVIAELEPWRRGVYTGVFGHVGADGSASFAMGIRTLEIETGPDARPAAYFTGGGIVADSSPERELEETGWKASQLEALSVVRGPA